MNKFIIAGEMPPNEMYKLLTSWGIKENLTLALINHYGGHIYDIHQALIRLRDNTEFFQPFRPELFANVEKCFSYKFETYTDQQKMTEMLLQLAVKGFCPLGRMNDPIAKVICDMGVGGLVTSMDTICGFPRAEFDISWSYGLIPSQQSQRLAIFQVLENFELI